VQPVAPNVEIFEVGKRRPLARNFADKTARPQIEYLEPGEAFETDGKYRESGVERQVQLSQRRKTCDGRWQRVDEGIARHVQNLSEGEGGVGEGEG
jgi:hypothetical protein